MARKRFTKRRALLIVAVLLAVGGIVWWLTRGPREPYYKGKSLSWWFTDGIDQQGPTFQRLTAEELTSLGPGAVKWLSYKAAQTSIWDRGAPSSPNNLSSFIWWLRDHWFDTAASRFERVRFESIVALEEFGPGAAPAIPALLDAVRHADNDARLVAAEALQEMGAASWPAVTNAIQHADLRTRLLLLEKMDCRWRTNDPLRPAEFAQIVEVLIPATFDGDEQIRSYAKIRLGECSAWWSQQPECGEGLRLMVDGVDRLNSAERRTAIDLLAGLQFRPAAATMIPGLAALAEKSDDLTRIHILDALAILDPDNPLWQEQLEKLAASPNPELAEAAKDALIHAYKRLPTRNGN